MPAPRIEDGNIVKLGAAPSQQPPVLGSWFDDAGDTVPARMITNPIWRVSTDDAHSGTKSYFAPNDNLRCDNLVTPPLDLGPGSMLNFWSDFEGPADAWLWAAGTIEVTSDGGDSWTRVAPIGGYPEYYNNNVLCDLAWEDCFGDYYPWAPWTVDLSAYADQTVQIRFHFTSHNFYPDPTIGWHVDDIQITNVWLPGSCTTQAGCPLAIDVLPDAPPAACTGGGVTFSAAVSGGTGPFTYQWTEDGSDIPGATGPSHTVSRLDTGTHSYNCRVTDSSPGCTERTDPVDVTAEWTAQCAPHVVLDTGYDPAGSLVEMCGDGDAFVEPGERWSALARLRNTGNTVAADVQASLVTNPASVVDAVVASGVASFGDIDPGLGALNFAERFQFCPVTTGTCGSDITFDVNGVTWTGGGNPPTDFPFVLQVPVGVSDPGEDVWHDLTPADPLNATFETVVSDLQAVTVASADSAVLSYGFSYAAGRVTIYETEFDSLIDWNRVNPVSLDSMNPDSCPSSGGGSGVVIGPGGLLQKQFTNQHTEVRMEFDHHSSSSLDLGEYLWAEYWIAVPGIWTPIFQGPDGGDDTWYCDEMATFPDPNYGSVSIKFHNDADVIGEDVQIDSFRLTGVTGDTWMTAVRVELQDAQGIWHVLKDYGVEDTGTYDLVALSVYNGPGTYRIRLSENAGGTAQLSTVAAGEGLHVVRNPVSQCDVSDCCTASSNPPPVGDSWLAGGSPATFARDGNTVTYTYDSTTCSGAVAIVAYGNIGDYSTYVGTADCDGDGTFDAGGLGNVWFNLIWVDAASVAGHPGYGSSGPRSLAAAGIGCGIALDNSDDGYCD